MAVETLFLFQQEMHFYIWKSAVGMVAKNNFYTLQKRNATQLDCINLFMGLYSSC